MNMEHMPSPENQEVTREAAIESLKSENKEVFMKWIEQREARAENENTSAANIECEIDKARLYADAGFLEQAREELRTTLDAARSEPDHDRLENMIWDVLEHIEELDESSG